MSSRVKPSALQAYYSHCFQANLLTALRSLKRAAPGNGIRALQDKVRARFEEQTEVPSISSRDEFVRAVVSAYRLYFHRALLVPRRRAWAESQLFRDLSTLIGGKRRSDPQAWLNLEKSIQKKLKHRGYHSLLGRVTPLRSLLIWRSQRETEFKVHLAESTQTVRVFLLDDFVELGWLHYATFGKYHVGGWAGDKALYCVLPAYRGGIGSEKFRKSYLSHEAQHFSDYSRFPGLSQSDLEYRAKLAELVAATHPRRLVDKFAREAKNDLSLPHCHAAHRVVTALAGRSRVRPMALRLLVADSARLSGAEIQGVSKRH